MAHKQWTQTFAGTVLAQYQEWGQSFTTAFADVGLTPVTALTAVVGGASWTWGTIPTRPTATPGHLYEVWALPTAMVPASPIYIKVIYGTRSTGQHSMSFVVGTDSAFAGVFAAHAGTTAGSTAMSGDQNYLSCDGYGLALHCGNNTAAVTRQSNFWFVVDRHRAIDGTELGTGTAVYSLWDATVIGGGNSMQISQFDHAATVPTVRNPTTDAPPCISPGFSASAARIDATGRTQIAPWWGVTPNSRGLSKMLGTYNVANHPAGVTQIDVEDFLDLAGEPYLAMGVTSGATGIDNRLTSPSDTGASIVLWWGA